MLYSSGQQQSRLAAQRVQRVAFEIVGSGVCMSSCYPPFGGGC